jgi:ABC-type Fe3+ transport system substrate-binding protein
MKTAIQLFFAVIILFALAACGGEKAPASGVVKAGPGAVSSNAPTMRLMTWRYLIQDKAIVEAFSSKYGVKVEVIVRPMGEIIADAVAGRKLEADVLIVPTLEDAVRLRGFNALQPFFVDAFTNGDVGDKYLDNEGYWAGLTRWTMVTVYNPNAVTSTEAATYRGLIEVTGRGIRVGMAHPDSSGFAGVVAGLYQNLNPDAAAVWAKYMYEKTSGGPNGSDTDQMNRMLAGQLDVAFVSLGAAVRWFLNGDPLHFKAAEIWRVRFPHTEATDVNFMNMTCVAMPANAANRAMGAKMIDFLFQESIQEQLSDAWFELPSQTFAEGNDYLFGLPDRVGIQVDGEMIEQHLPAAWSIINQVAEAQQ